MLSPTLWPALERALHELRYGTVQLVVHDGQVVRTREDDTDERMR